MDKFQKSVQKDLLEGEKILAAVKAAPSGFLEGAILSSATYVATGVYPAGANFGAGAKEKGQSDRAAAGLDLGNQNQVAVGLTEKRLLIWSTNWLGKPKKLLGAVNVENIKSIERVNSKLFVANMPALRVTIEGDNSFDLQVGKIHAKKLDAVVSAFSELGQ